jgi:hypothetical protein
VSGLRHEDTQNPKTKDKREVESGILKVKNRKLKVESKKKLVRLFCD